MEKVDRLQRVGGRPSLLTKATIQAAYSLNVGNLRNTGHSAEAMPPAAVAEEATVGRLFLSGWSSAKGDAGLEIAHDRCATKTGR